MQITPSKRKCLMTLSPAVLFLVCLILSLYNITVGLFVGVHTREMCMRKFKRTQAVRNAEVYFRFGRVMINSVSTYVYVITVTIR